jgi:hypothetical protein
LVAAALEHPDLGLQDQVKKLAVAHLVVLGAVDELVGIGRDAVQAQL